ncbi:MAG: alpha-E domain-containing protein [Acidimicrobiales bacterium]|nr:alpha-E domain-containing protein [Acidimicrobiales bacterium]
MLARHAESLFWTGRYLERAEDTARMLDVTYHGLLESPPAQARGSWHDLLRVLSLDEAFDWDAHAADGAELAGAISEFLVLDQENPGAIGNAVLRARENVRSVRELVSTELWEAINGFWLELQRRDGDLNRPQRLIGRLKAELEYRDVSELLDEDLHGFLDRLQAGVREVAGAVGPPPSATPRPSTCTPSTSTRRRAPRTRWWSR